MKKFLTTMMLITALAVSGITACSSTTPEREIVVQLGVEVAAIRFIGENKERAAAALYAMNTIELFLTSEEELTVQQLSDVLFGLVDWGKLNPTEQALVRATIALVVNDLYEVVPGGLLDPEVRARVMLYTGAVKRVAQTVLGDTVMEVPLMTDLPGGEAPTP